MVQNMAMNKKQVGAFLKVVGKDPARVTLSHAKIDTYNGRTVLMGTDGYKLAAIYIDEADELVGKLLPREAIERWYKLATGKSRLTGREIVESLAQELTEGNYPEWQKLVPQGDTLPQTTMRFNAEFFKIMQDLTGNADMTVKFYGEVHPMVIESEDGVFVVMPMKQV